MNVCRANYTHPIPANCDSEMAKILKSCWLSEPEARPTFEQLYQQLTPIAQKYGVDVYS